MVPGGLQPLAEAAGDHGRPLRPRRRAAAGGEVADVADVAAVAFGAGALRRARGARAARSRSAGLGARAAGAAAGPQAERGVAFEEPLTAETRAEVTGARPGRCREAAPASGATRRRRVGGCDPWFVRSKHTYSRNYPFARLSFRSGS